MFSQIAVVLARAARRIGLVVSIHAVLITTAVATSGSTDRRKERIGKLLHTNVGSEANEWVTLLYHGSISLSILVAVVLMFVKSSKMSSDAIGVQAGGMHNALVVIGALAVALMATRDLDPSASKPDWWIVLYAAPVLCFNSLGTSKVQNFSLKFVTLLLYGATSLLFLIFWIMEWPSRSTWGDWQSLKTIGYLVGGFWIFLVLCAWSWLAVTQPIETVPTANFIKNEQDDGTPEIKNKPNDEIQFIHSKTV